METASENFVLSAYQIWSFFVHFFLRALQYIDRDGVEEFLSMESYPQTLAKKITLLNYFRNYMNEHLLKVIIFFWFPVEFLFICHFVHRPAKI